MDEVGGMILDRREERWEAKREREGGGGSGGKARAAVESGRKQGSRPRVGE